MATKIRYPSNAVMFDGEQRAVIDWMYGPVVVSASAGSGKTSTIIERIAKLIRQDRIDPRSILATTFTKKAAEEMMDRLYAKGIDTRSMSVRTMHGYCWSIIRSHSRFSGFSIDDKDYAKIILKKIVGFQDMKWKNCDITLVEKFIAECRNALVSPEDSVSFKTNSYDERYSQAYFKFSEAMWQRKLISFDDMLYYGVKLLKEDNQLLSTEQGKYEFVVVDEYQDSNVAQVELSLMIARPEMNLMVVGDVDQCHPWNTPVEVKIGVQYEKVSIDEVVVGDVVKSFDSDTLQITSGIVTRVGTREYDGPIVRIRAGGRVVEVTPDHRIPTDDGVILAAKEVEVGHRVFVSIGGISCWEPVTSVENTDTRRLSFHDGFVYSLEVENDHTYFADGIAVHNCIYEFRGAVPQHMLEFQKMTGGDLLELSNNYRCAPDVVHRASRVIGYNEKRFSKAVNAARKCDSHVEYFVAEDQDDEAERVSEHIKQLTTDGVPYKEMFVMMRTNAQSRGFEEAFVRHGIPFVILGGISFYERREVQDLLAYLKVAIDPSDVSSGIKSIGRPFRFIRKDDLDNISNMVDVDYGFVDAADVVGSRNNVRGIREYVTLMRSINFDMPPSNVLIEIVNRTKLKERMVQEEGSDSTENNRLDNIDGLISSAARFSTCGEFITYVNRQIRLRKADSNKKDQNKVQVSTVHKQKGCQAVAVFVTGVNDGLFPHAKCINVEEERRLFFVAMTRAKDHLFVSSIRTNNGRPTPISKFVIEAALTSTEEDDSVEELAFPEEE